LPEEIAYDIVARSVRHQILMKTMESAEASKPLSDEESLALSSHPGFRRAIKAAREEAARGAVVSLEEMKHEML